MENKQLDVYVSALGKRLKELPPLQREVEMSEVRQHLEALVFAHIQQGKSQDEAVNLAIRQFGKAESIGRELNGALSKGRYRSTALFVAKYFGIWLGTALIQFFFFTSMMDKVSDFPYSLEGKIVLAVVLASSGLAGNLALKKRHSLRA